MVEHIRNAASQLHERVYVLVRVDKNRSVNKLNGRDFLEFLEYLPMFIIADHIRKNCERLRHVVLEAFLDNTLTLKPLLDLREVRQYAFLGGRTIHGVNSVPEAAEVATSGGIPIKGVRTKSSIFTQELTDDFAYKNGSRSVNNLEFL